MKDIIDDIIYTPYHVTRTPNIDSAVPLSGTVSCDRYTAHDTDV